MSKFIKAGRLVLVLAAVLFAACAGGPKFADLQGKEWTLTEVRPGSAPIQFDRSQLTAEGFPNIFTMSIDTEKISGSAASNTYTASYTPGDNQALSIAGFTGTQNPLAQQPERLKEHDFFIYLQNISKWNLVNGNLELSTKGENGTETVLVFSPPAAN